MSLPSALQPLATFNQFITYITRPSKTRKGKLDKLPTNWKTAQIDNAQDPAIWIDYDTCYALGGGKVGFVFSDRDPFWFLDIDNCLLPNGQWSPLALELVALLPGAACEVSISGKGLHLFGTGKIPKHTCRNEALGLEFYHTGRFVALGTGAVGNAFADCTEGLAIMVERYFKRGQEDERSEAGWTNAPDPSWRGSADDDELIRRVCKSKSSASIFGVKATFQQLWEADALALAKAFPAEGRDFDHSSADAALAQHLAFWTGKDCERMVRLMNKSMLKREKWVEHKGYMGMTVSNAVAKQIDVCQDKPVMDTKSLVTRDVEGLTILSLDQQKELFKGYTYVADVNKIFTPDGFRYDQMRFEAMVGSQYSFVMDSANAKITKSSWDAFRNSQLSVFQRAHSSSFRPDKPVGDLWQEGNKVMVNSYMPIPVRMVQGDARPFIDHIVRMLPDPNDQAILMAYMAALVQYRGVKFQWCPLIQGAPGNGKSLLSRCIIAAIGIDHCYLPNSAQMTDKFNDWIDEKIFIAVEDVYVPHEKQEILECLKPMITSDTLELQGKGTQKVTRHICANFMLNSNHKTAIVKSRDDRRFAVFFCAQQFAEDIVRDNMGGTYFPVLYGWLKRDGYAIVADYLMHYKIADELNPAKTCHRAPVTSSTPEAINESQGILEQEILGAILEDRIGFRDGWVSSHYLMLLIRECGSKPISRLKRRDILRDMGFVIHPGLRNGQVDNPVQPDGTKSSLYVKKGHPSIALEGLAVSRAYTAAQVTINPLKLVM